MGAALRSRSRLSHLALAPAMPFLDRFALSVTAFAVSAMPKVFFCVQAP